MRFNFLIGVVLITISSIAYGVDALIITKDGVSIVGHNVVKRGNILSYTTNVGKRESIELKELYQVLPKVVRGHKYDPKQVAKYIKYARKTMRKFTKLRKQMQPLLDEWLAIRRQFEQLTPEAQAKMKKQINEMFATYARSARSDADFNRLRGELEMLRYKDLQGMFEDIIDSRLDALGKVFVTRSLGKLNKSCSKRSITLDAFRDIAAFEKQLTSYHPPEAQMNVIKQAMAKARTTCVQTEIKAATAIFAKNRSLDGYLTANQHISKLLNDVAEPRHNFIINRCRKAMQGKLQGYDFGVRGLTGFPVTKDDKATLMKTRPWVSKPSEPISDPAAIIFPAKFVPQIVMRGDDTIVVRAIFCRKPPEGYLGLNVQPYDIVVWNRIRTVKDAHAEIRFTTASFRKAIQQSLDPNQKPDRIRLSLIVGDPSQGGSQSIVLSNGSEFRLKH